jgi:sulfur-oxidizing protein SoxA
MLFVERGAELWETPEGEAGKSCADCHGDAAESMAGVGAAMPKWNDELNQPVNLEMQVNQCRSERMQAEPYKFDADDQKAMATFIRNLSLGQPVKIDLEAGEMQSWWDRGKEAYYTRTGQLQLSCANCHELNNGLYIRADHLSQGNTNGFPTYRLKQGTIISLHNRFRGCIRDTRGTQPAAFSDTLIALEVYTAWRGQGLSVETPAVRQ